MKVSPSLLAADFADLKNEVAKIATADMLHLDVMDGIFVPNISFGAGVIGALRPHTDLFFDVHLMITDPQMRLIPSLRNSSRVDSMVISQYGMYEQMLLSSQVKG